MSDANAAADRLNVLIRKNGRDFLRMPASVKAYLGQELATFPEEKAVLEAAFDAGVHDQVCNLNGEIRPHVKRRVDVDQLQAPRRLDLLAQRAALQGREDQRGPPRD